MNDISLEELMDQTTFKDNFRLVEWVPILGIVKYYQNDRNNAPGMGKYLTFTRQVVTPSVITTGYSMWQTTSSILGLVAAAYYIFN